MQSIFFAQHYQILPLWQKLFLIGCFPFFKFKYKRYFLSHLRSRFISPSLCSQHRQKLFPFIPSRFLFPSPFHLQASKLPLHITLNNFIIIFQVCSRNFLFLSILHKYIKHMSQDFHCFMYAKLPWQQPECLYLSCFMLYDFFLLK